MFLLILRRGIVQFLGIVFGGFAAFFPDELDWVLDNWGEVGQDGEGLSHWPGDITGDIRPVACHSHNDYWRKVPLYSALNAGCIGVEADVWLFDEELYVGHSLSSLTHNRTLNNLYLNPILDILEKQNPNSAFHPNPDTPRNGVFDVAPTQTLILLIDYKTSGKPLHPFVLKQLQPLREKKYLTHFNGTDVVEGPITIVATGNAPFDLLMQNATYRDVFFDAPLDQMADKTDGSIASPHVDPLDSTREDLPANPYSPYIESATTDLPLPSAPTAVAFSDTDQGQGHSGGAPLDPAVYSPQNSYYASVSFSKSIGFPWRSRLSAKQLELIRKQIRGAHAQGLKVRYWNLPAWPRGLRNHIWHILVREGVDVLNVDDLVGATRRDWRKGKGWWY